MTPTLNFVSAANSRRANNNDADAPAAPPMNFRLDRCLTCSISFLSSPLPCRLQQAAHHSPFRSTAGCEAPSFRRSCGMACDLRMDCIPHARKHAAHIGEAAGHAGHRVVGVDLVLQVDEAFVLIGDERFKDSADRHLAVTHCYLALLDVQVVQVLHMDVEEARSDFMDGLDDVCAGAHGVAYIDAAADSRVHVFDDLQDVERRPPELVFRTMVVDRDFDVVLLDELLYPRKTGGGGGAR